VRRNQRVLSGSGEKVVIASNPSGTINFRSSHFYPISFTLIQISRFSIFIPMVYSLLHMVACSIRYKHLGQFAPLGGEQTAAQLPGDWVSIGHSSQWLWYSVYARYCLYIYSQNCLNFETFISTSY
jgi:hypothetical protein